MIAATIPLEKVKVTLKNQDSEVPTVVYFEQSNIQIAFGEIVSLEFALTNGKIRMVTRQFMADKLVADTQTIASLPPDHKNK